MTVVFLLAAPSPTFPWLPNAPRRLTAIRFNCMYVGSNRLVLIKAHWHRPQTRMIQSALLMIISNPCNMGICGACFPLSSLARSCAHSLLVGESYLLRFITPTFNRILTAALIDLFADRRSTEAYLSIAIELDTHVSEKDPLRHATDHYDL
ncbi:hypothetical protein C8R44DRAFT_322336 [Mycena epipterygia]|nr:hypothetical protein C8R44DRAFT_322336 [Mycena epipterygia]